MSRQDELALGQILESAARLRRLVPDAVLVGGAAAALHAGHRLSFDHDHVLADRRDRFDAVLDDIESDEAWQLRRMTPGRINLGELDGIETGVRQMRRERPLEVERVTLPSGAVLTAPTLDETLRVKAFLAVQRNQVRDYLDIGALADPRPNDLKTLTRLSSYKGLAARWTSWQEVKRVLGEVAAAMLAVGDEES